MHRHDRSEDDFIETHFRGKQYVSYNEFLTHLMRQYQQLWSDPDDGMFRQIAERLHVRLEVQDNCLDIRVLRRKCRDVGILGLILEVMKQLNNHRTERQVFEQISDIMPQSYSGSMSKQSLLSQHFFKQGIQPVKNHLQQVSNYLTIEGLQKIDQRYREMNANLLKKMGHFEKILVKLTEKQKEMQDRRKLQMTIIELQSKVNKLQRELQGQRYKRRTTVDARYLKQPESTKNLNATFKENFNRHNFRM